MAIAVSNLDTAPITVQIQLFIIKGKGSTRGCIGGGPPARPILPSCGFYFFLLWLEIVDCTGKIKILKKVIPTPPPARNPWRCQPQGWIHVCSLQIIYNIGTKILYETCFATKMLFLFCKSMIPVRFCTIFPLHSCAGIKTRFKALLKTEYLTLGPDF